MTDLTPSFSAATNIRTVECPVCGAHVVPSGHRVGPHNEQRVRAVRDEGGKQVHDHLNRPVTEVYVSAEQCDGSGEPPVGLDGALPDGRA